MTGDRPTRTATFLLVLASAFALGGTAAFAIGAVAAVVLGTVAVLLVKGASPETRLDPFVGFLLGTAALSVLRLGLAAAEAAPAPSSEARLEVYRGLALAGLAALGFRAARRHGPAAITRPAAAAAVLVALFGIVQGLAGEGTFWLAASLPENARPFGPFVHRNHFAALCAAALPLTVLAAGRERSAIWGVGSALLALGAVLPGSRTGASALLAALAVGLLSPSLGGKTRLGLASLGAVALALAPGATVGRFLAEGPGLRLDIWSDSLRLVAMAPLLGGGPGAFLDAYPAVRSVAGPWGVSHAESDLLHLLVEQGILVGLPLALALGVAVRRGARAALAGGARGVEATALLASLAALAVAGLVDVPWRGVGFGGFGALVAGCAASTEGGER